MEYFIYLLLGFIIIYVEITRERYFVIDHLTFFHFFFFLVYSFAPVALMFMGTDIVPYDLAYGKFHLGKNPHMPYVILVAYLIFLSGYYWSAPRRAASNIYVEFKLSETALLSLIIIGYLFLILIMVVYIQSNGGLSRTISNAENFRSGTLIANKPYLVKLFSLNQIFLYYTFFRVFLSDNPKHKKIFMALFALSVTIFFIRVALLNSRGFILLTGLGAYVIIAIHNKKYYFKYLMIAGVAGVLFLKYGDPLFRAIPDLANDGFDKFVTTFERRVEHANMQQGTVVSNFLHPIISLTTALSVAGDSVEYRYLTDFYGAIIGIMPNSLIGIEEPHLVQSVITKLLFAVDQPIVLPGILATFTFSFGIIGIFVLLFLYGVYGGFLAEFFRNIYNRYNGSIVLIYLVSMSYGYFVFRGSPKNFLLGMFSPIVVIVLLLLFSKIGVIKSNHLNKTSNV